MEICDFSFRMAYSANPLQQHYIIVAQFPALSTNWSPEYSSGFDGDWQLGVILVHDQLLDAGKGRSFESEITLAGGLDNEVLVAVPADTQYDLALLVPDGLTDQEVAIVVQQPDNFLARQNAVEPFLLVERSIRGERYLQESEPLANRFFSLSRKISGGMQEDKLVKCEGK